MWCAKRVLATVIPMSNRPIPETISYTYERVDPEYPVPAPVTQAELEQMPAEETRTVEIERTEAEELLEEINDAVEQRQRNRTIEELVLGVEEYIVADTYCRYAYDQPFGNWYGLDVTVVPGSMIAPVVPNRVRREEYLQESDSLQPHKGPSGTMFRNRFRRAIEGILHLLIPSTSNNPLTPGGR